MSSRCCSEKSRVHCQKCRGARAVLLCVTSTCPQGCENSLLPWLWCSSVATQLCLCQLVLQGLQQLCKASVPIAAEYLHLPCGRPPQLWRSIAQCAYSANVVTLGHNFFWTPQSALFFLKCIIMVVERGAHFFLKIWSLFGW